MAMSDGEMSDGEMIDAEMGDKAFLLISIGPIQDFIASARRCQDLWFGSYLLSHLSRKVAEALREQGGDVVTMIFPGNETLDDKVAVANKIAAVVPAEQAEALGKKADNVVFEEISWLADRVFDRIQSDSLLGRHLHREPAEHQVGNLMECQWVSVPCAGLESASYVDARARAEELLAARKNTRDWSSCDQWAGSVPKSALDGQRESVIDEALFDSGSSWPRARQVFGVQRAERLCGVGLLKRLGSEIVESPDGTARFKRRPHFHSTSHMAAAPLFGHFERSEVREAFDSYLDALAKAGGESVLAETRLKGDRGLRGEKDPRTYDGSLLYEGRLEDLLAGDGESKQTLRERLTVPRKKLRDLLSAMGHQPSPYYAMLLADGDRMGKVIDAQQGAQRHAELSEALDAFARSARDVVEDEHQGSLIYAGGDDVLALVPLNRAVACARELSDSFNTSLEAFRGVIDGDPVPTLSVGVVMAHHLAHFADVRQVARRAEALAKTKRNALAVIVDKRSGGERSFVGQWDFQPPIDERLGLWLEMIGAGEVSHGFLREVEDLGRLVEATGGPETDRDLSDEFEHLLEHELERIMARKQPGVRSEVGLSDRIKTTLREYIADGKATRGGVAANIAQLGSELYFALELHRVEQLTPDSEKEQAA